MEELALHGVIQALANSVLLGLLLVLLVELTYRRATWNARTRYLLGWLAMGVLVLSPILLLLRSMEPPVTDTPGARLRLERVEPDPRPADNRVLEGEVSVRSEAPALFIERATRTATNSVSRASTSVQGERRIGGFELSLTDSLAALLLVIYLAGLATRLLQVLASAVAIRRLKGGAVVTGDGNGLLEEWSRIVATSRRVRLAESPSIGTPMAVGFFSPTILLPSGLERRTSRQELDQLGIHELAHLGRYDDWALLLQKLLEALFWCHPGVLGIARRLDLDRELACDDIAISATERPEIYARCLARLVELSAPPVRRRFCTTLTVDHLVLRRLRMILDAKRSRTRSVSPIPLLSVFLLIAAVATVTIAAPPILTLTQAEDESIRGSVVDIETRGGDRSHVVWSSGGRTIELWVDGAVQIGLDPVRIDSIDTGGRLKLRERKGLRVRSVTVEPGPDGPGYRYASMGIERGFGSEEQAWFDQALSDAIESSGYMAKARAQQILAQQGADALIEAIPEMDGEPARGISLETLVSEAELSPEQQSAAAGLSMDEVEAEHRRAEILSTLVAAGWGPLTDAKTYFSAIQSLPSEHRRDELIRQTFSAPLGDQEVDPFLHAVQFLPSEHRRDELLRMAIEDAELTRSQQSEVVQEIGNLPSEHRRSELLTLMVADLPPEGAALDLFFGQLSGLPSEHRREDLLRVVLERDDDFVQENLEVVNSVVYGLPSEHRRAALAGELLGRFSWDRQATLELLGLVESLPSEHRVAELIESLLESDELSPEVLKAMLVITKSQVPSGPRRGPLVEELYDRIVDSESMRS